MDFKDAIKTHVAWKTKLSHYIAKPDGSLNSVEVGNERNCELGKLLHAAGPNRFDSPEYASLRKEHARFHAAAADVIRRANAGQRVTEEIALGSDSEFASASAAVVSALIALKR